jgi:hypothetical protein
LLSTITGTAKGGSEPYTIGLPKHPWVKHLSKQPLPAWINKGNAQPIRYAQGEAVIGNTAGMATLYRAPVGQGQLIYLGWDISASLPNGRGSSTVEQETAYEQQMHILLNVVESIYPQ